MSDQPSGFFSRLLRLPLLGALLVAAIVVAVVGFRQAGSHYRAQERQARIVSTLVAVELAPALTLTDVDRAEAVLAALRAEPRIAAAGVYDGKGALFASYRRADVPAAETPAKADKPEKLELLPETAPRHEVVHIHRAVEASVEVADHGQPVGTFYLRQEIEWRSFATALLLTGVGVLAGVALLALFFSTLQAGSGNGLSSGGAKASELAELTALVRNAAARRDYTAAVPLRGPAEGRELALALQQLLRGFLLEEKEQADALRSSRADLDTLRAAAARLESRKEILEREADVLRTAPAPVPAASLDVIDRLRQELRDPLQGILQGVRALKRDRQLVNPPHRELVAIEGNATHLLTAIDDTVDLAAALSPEPGTPAPFELPALLSALAEVARARAAAQGSVFTFEQVGTLPSTVTGDARRLRQVLGGLLGNAARLTPRRGRIDLVVGAVGEQIRFEVRDTGAPREEGTGPGLAIAQAEALVILQGGTLKARTTAEGVHVFRFDLPLPAA